MTKHKYICTVVVETDEKVTKKALRESIEYYLATPAYIIPSTEAEITKVRVGNIQTKDKSGKW